MIIWRQKKYLYTPAKTSLKMQKSVVSRQTRCTILTNNAKIHKLQTILPITRNYKENRVSSAKKKFQSDFSKVTFMDESRATQDRPDGWSRNWILDGTVIGTKVQWGFLYGIKEDGVMFWAGIVGNNIIGPFRVHDGVKWTRSATSGFWRITSFSGIPRKRLSRDFLVSNRINEDQPPSSPDSNCIENISRWQAINMQEKTTCGKLLRPAAKIWIVQ